ncbi:uncharacterized protein LOC135395010 [Ornithodoros turicata]|uniref:uncharacterized protein LOC135395010 n=1 Tax=Ornithodoros turicata TaxID=34597 RepID=UPI003139B187
MLPFAIVIWLSLFMFSEEVYGQQTQEELPFDDLMAAICRKYDNAADRKEAIACVGDRMEIELEVIVADCMSRQFRMKNMGDRAFDMLCQDDSRKMDRVYDCVDDQADSQGGRDWTVDEVAKFAQMC